MKFIIKLFPEIIVKSRPVRKQFISQLRKNLKKVLSPIINDPKISGTWDHIELNIDDNSDCVRSQQENLIIDKLQATPGIEFVLKVNSHSFESIDDIANIVVAEYSDIVKDKKMNMAESIFF